MRPRASRVAIVAGLLAALAGAAGTEPPATADRRLVVVVNRRHPESDISLHALSRIYRGEQRFWENGDRIYPLLPPEDQPEARASFLATVVKLDPRAYALHWRNMIFRGDVTDQPISPPDERHAVQTVFAERGGLAVVEGSAIKNLEQVAKVLTVNGHARTDPEYPLKW
jgi:hypothetical protein